MQNSKNWVKPTNCRLLRLFVVVCMLSAALCSGVYAAGDNAGRRTDMNDTESVAQPGQAIAVTGVVTDETGATVTGVNVLEKGTSNGVVTDVNGRYRITVAGTESVLTFSFIGYLTEEAAVGNRADISVRLQEDAVQIDEVVVLGYNTVRKKDLTTAVAIVSTNDINERPITSAAQAIQGKAAGVQVIQPSGQPGTSLSIRVRGATSVQAGNEPLYVVDGLPTTSISHINPNDLESIQILKDASSAAIYGARAANGVVLITTKRGKAGAPVINLSAYAGVSRLGKKIDALDTEQYKEYIKDLRRYQPTVPEIPDEETRYTDWTDTFFGTGINQNYQLSLSSGTDRMRYFISAGYMDEQGIVEKSNYKRYSFRTNIDNQQTDWLKIGLNLSYSNSGGTSVYENRSAMRAGSILSVINTPPYMQVWNPNNALEYDEFAYGARILSPLAANAADQEERSNRFIGSANFVFTLLDGLNYKLNFGVDAGNAKRLFFLDPISNSDGRSNKGRVEEGYNKSFEWLLENLITYDKTFRDRHNLSLLAGATLQQSRVDGSNVAGFDLSESYSDMRSFSSANQIDKDGTWAYGTEWALASFLGRVSYDYESKYLITANIRADGSSKFAPGHKWGVFPSVSAGWRISGESFMAGTSRYISDLKLRVGWGLNGNQEGIGNYDYLSQKQISRVVPDSNTTLPGLAISPSTPGNRELTWETTSQYNAGIDLSMFKSRLNITLDAYYKYTTDLLMTVYVSDIHNLPGGITRNDGEMENKGLEVNVSSRNFIGQFRWDTDFNISMNKNKITNLGLRPVYYYAPTYESGQDIITLRKNLPLGTFYGYISEGVDPETGDIIYKDNNENDMIDPEDRTAIGNAQPKFIFGITNSFSYANFDFSFFLQGSYGNKIFNASRIDMIGMMDFKNQSTDVLRRWMRPGMETDIPRPGNIVNNYNSTRFVEDGSYLRLKSVTLAYNLSPRVLEKIKVKKLQPYVTAQNLLTWTNYSGYDPEVNAYGSSSVELGVDYGTYPQSKAVIFGINVEF